MSSSMIRLQSPGASANTTAASRRVRRFTPAMLLHCLPSLGSVLYLPSCERVPLDGEMPCGLLVESVSLAPLLRTCWLKGAGLITADGPREWIDCLDRTGHVCASLHLLPDTDYLAWDAMLASGELATMPLARDWSRSTRPATAELLSFHVQRIAGLSLLGSDAVTHVSSLGRHLARQIACAEAVPLRLTSDN